LAIHFQGTKLMKFRSILGGIVALPLLFAAASANDATQPQQRGIQLPGVFLPLPKSWQRNREPAGETTRLAQAGDPRVTALEEQIRQLSGTIEELNFQILQMQEQMRKMQEDNEFRFQELEGKRSDAGAGRPNRAVSEAPGTENMNPSTPDTGTSATPNPQAGGAVATAPADSRDPSLGGEPKTFGTITFDRNGNVTGGSVGDQATVGGTAPPSGQPTVEPVNPPTGGADDTKVAALPSTDDPEELYRNSYQFILSGDYGTAEAGFRDHIARFPGDTKTPDAHFWLGEALLGQKKYRDAAEVFLAANKDYPKSKKAPEMLFKLGVSLAGLNQRDVACATFSEVGKRYHQTSAALKERVKQEQALAAC
jgi:tol-pal system protein YbgF